MLAQFRETLKILQSFCIKCLISTSVTSVPFLQIIHPWLQMGNQSPCEKKACSHMCVFARGPKAVCKCPSGLVLAEDRLTCSGLVNSAFLLMLSPSTVTQVNCDAYLHKKFYLLWQNKVYWILLLRV